MNNENLNLARKLRPKNFNEVVGQQLCLRILKNGLYSSTFFPLYLFAGQRGCGKTTTARIFASAVNCHKLEDFTKNPKQFLPCLECDSCVFMSQNKHPDFIEIDAASHTGVDNVRQIVENSSFMPLLGRKKIYLIDEAHMLSKAAFNAFLKILEEPPATVLFILATTDPQKIIDTVRSRSFQLFFSALSESELLTHLESICKNESIGYDQEGLKAIIKESQGSVRDAINLLEQVRFSSSSVTRENVIKALGYIQDEHVVNILKFLCNENSLQLVNYLDQINFKAYTPENVWLRLIEALNTAMRLKLSLKARSIFEQQLHEALNEVNLERIMFIAQELFKSELIFLKSLNKHLFLELQFLKLISYSDIEGSSCVSSESSEAASRTPVNNIPFSNIKDVTKISEALEKPVEEKAPWQLFLDLISNSNDQLLHSIFSQANFQNFDPLAAVVTISLSQSFNFFNDVVNDKLVVWQPLLDKAYNCKVKLNLISIKADLPVQPIAKPMAQVAQEIKKVDVQESLKKEATVKKVEEYRSNYNNFNNNFKRNNAPVVKKINSLDVSDKSKWKIANMLLEHFSGTVEEIQDQDE